VSTEYNSTFQVCVM